VPEEWRFGLASIRYDDLICLAFRHRWVPTAGEYRILGGARVILWELTCESGCGGKATELRDEQGFRIPGTQRQYRHTDQYSRSTGYSQGEYITEIHERQRDMRRESKRTRRLG
jgi:hypothetical protein